MLRRPIGSELATLGFIAREGGAGNRSALMELDSGGGQVLPHGNRARHVHQTAHLGDNTFRVGVNAIVSALDEIQLSGANQHAAFARELELGNRPVLDSTW